MSPTTYGSLILSRIGRSVFTSVVDNFMWQCVPLLNLYTFNSSKNIVDIVTVELK